MIGTILGVMLGLFAAVILQIHVFQFSANYVVWLGIACMGLGVGVVKLLERVLK